MTAKFPNARKPPPRLIPECMKHLPVYRGLPVPYVAIWSAETVGPGITWSPTGLRIGARPELLKRGNEGVWWLSGPDKREGTPMFGGTHSARQRKCMSQGRCQVCGRRFAKSRLLWVIADSVDHRDLHDKYDMIVNPPVCPDCYAGALTLCPHLISHGDKAEVYRGNPRIVGLHGTRIYADHSSEPVYMPLTEPDRKWVMGRQYVITLDDEVRVS